MALGRGLVRPRLRVCGRWKDDPKAGRRDASGRFGWVGDVVYDLGEVGVLG